MKVLIAYPPLEGKPGYATLGQNRQFQYFADPTFIYPVVPAVAATRLSREGHEVTWRDCPAEGIGREDFFRLLREEKPDLAVFETKTPVVKYHWNLIGEIKASVPKAPLVVLMGDHVTALPEESLNSSAADFVLTGGDYDFSLSGLCSHLADPEKPLPGGIWRRGPGGKPEGSPFRLAPDLSGSPWIDRDLTKWELYT